MKVAGRRGPCICPRARALACLCAGAPASGRVRFWRWQPSMKGRSQILPHASVHRHCAGNSFQDAVSLRTRNVMGNEMLHITLLACLLSASDRCQWMDVHTRELQLFECLVASQPAAAEWQQEHPAYRVAKVRCEPHREGG